MNSDRSKWERYRLTIQDPLLVELRCRWLHLSDQWQRQEAWGNPEWRETLSASCSVIRQMQARRKELGLHPVHGYPEDSEIGEGVILF